MFSVIIQQYSVAPKNRALVTVSRKVATMLLPVTSLNADRFLPRDATLASAAYAVVVCLSVFLSQVGVLLKQLPEKRHFSRDPTLTNV